MQEVTKGMPAFEVVHQVLEGNPGPRKHGIPFITSGSTTITGSAGMASIYRVCQNWPLRAGHGVMLRVDDVVDAGWTWADSGRYLSDNATYPANLCSF